jgi:hypothetical protein
MSHARRLFLLGLIAIAASATACSVASAAEESPHYIKGGVEIAKETAVKSTINTFFFKILNLKLLILCGGVDSHASIGPKWQSKVTIEFSKCMTREPATGCEVEPEFDFILHGQLLYKAGKKGEEIYDVFFGEIGKVFKFTGNMGLVPFLETNTCAFNADEPVKGSAIAVPKHNKPGEEAEVLELKFNGETAPTGEYINRENEAKEQAGKIEFGFGNAAFLEGEIKMELAGKEKFGVQ